MRKILETEYAKKERISAFLRLYAITENLKPKQTFSSFKSKQRKRTLENQGARKRKSIFQKLLRTHDQHGKCRIYPCNFTFISLYNNRSSRAGPWLRHFNGGRSRADEPERVQLRAGGSGLCRPSVIRSPWNTTYEHQHLVIHDSHGGQKQGQSEAKVTHVSSA